MRCSNCGTDNNQFATFCSNCGAPLLDADNSQQTPNQMMPGQDMNYQNAQGMNQQYAGQQVNQPYMGQQMDQQFAGQQMNYGPMTIEQFAELPAMSGVKKQITAAAIMCYVSAVITLLVMLLTSTFPIDAIIVAVLGIFIQKKKSFVASCILLAYGIISLLVAIVLFGTVGGWLLIVAGGFAVYATNKLKNAYKYYQLTGNMPQ